MCEAGETYCPEHKKERTARYEAGRGTAAERGYGGRWLKHRRRFLKEHPYCVCGNPASEVDHTRPVPPTDPLFWDPANHQALCRSCHSRKTAKQDGGFGNRPS